MKRSAQHHFDWYCRRAHYIETAINDHDRQMVEWPPIEVSNWANYARMAMVGLLAPANLISGALLVDSFKPSA